MKELHLPHQEPIKFAKYILSKDENAALVRVEFENIPTLPMLIESAAQSSAALSKDERKMGFLVSLKNIELMQKPKVLSYDVKITKEHSFGNMTYIGFEVLDENAVIAKGSFVIALQ